MSYTGNLISLQDIGSNPVTWTDIPLKYIRYSTYKVTPCQRLDLDTGLRDLTGKMHRNVVNHVVTKIEFELASMSSGELDSLMQTIRSRWIRWLERDVNLRYYDPENNVYRTGHFYMPDIPFDIRNIDETNNRINYNQIRLAFIEY